MQPAKTGKDNNNNKAVNKTDQQNNGINSKSIPRQRIFNIVTIKFTAPAMDDTPAICREYIAKSTDAPECDKPPDNGGYTVQPVPTPDSTKLETTKKNKDIGNNQKLKLFNLGKAMSGAPINIGTNQLPNAPISKGITIKKIIVNACAVIITLYN